MSQKPTFKILYIPIIIYVAMQSIWNACFRFRLIKLKKYLSIPVNRPARKSESTTVLITDWLSSSRKKQELGGWWP